MAGWVFGDAVNLVPTYTGRAWRLLASAMQSKPSGRPLGGYSGVSPGTPQSILSVTSSQWSVQPFTGFLDVSAAGDGGTPFAFDSTTTNGVNSADSSNPRVDLLYIRHDDPAESAGPAAPAAVIGYLAGTAAATPSLPATPARAIPLARINVPKLNNGSPTITLIAPVTVAAGGIMPVADSTLYPATPYVGQFIDDATLGLQRWDGTAWQAYGKGGDTGWLDIPYATGFAFAGTTSDSKMQVRIKNGVWYVQGTVLRTAGNLAASSAYTVSGVLPVPRPSSSGNGYSTKPLAGGGGAAGAGGYIDASNRLVVNTGPAATSFLSIDGLSGYPAT
jgi:hypothetical protein